MELSAETIEELKQYLLSRSDVVESGCREWQGCCGSHGYGQITFKTKGMITHRAMYEVFFGAIPKGKMVLHKCDNRRCINPEHLFLGTAADNTKDMIAKGRDNLDCNAKLSDEQVREIRELYFTNLSQIEVAKRFDISQATVSRVGTGISYWWVI